MSRTAPTGRRRAGASIRDHERRTTGMEPTFALLDRFEDSGEILSAIKGAIRDATHETGDGQRPHHRPHRRRQEHPDKRGLPRAARRNGAREADHQGDPPAHEEGHSTGDLRHPRAGAEGVSADHRRSRGVRGREGPGDGRQPACPRRVDVRLRGWKTRRGCRD